MKNLKIIALVCILGFLSIDSFGQYQHQERNRYRTRQNVAAEPVGTPIDGGLLAILGAAGLGYFVARKRKKNLP